MNFRNPLLETARTLRSGIARMAALLPGSSMDFGPPRREATTRSVDDASALIRHPLLPARSSLRPVAELADPPLQQLMMHPRKAAIKEVFMAELPQGRYWGRYHGYILDRHDNLITDLSPTFAPGGKRHEGLDQIQLPPVRELRGKVAVINTLYANNFHHWLLDTLPRFEWLRRAGWNWSEIDHFILPEKLFPFHFETLEILGIDKRKVIGSNSQTHLRAELLLVPCPSEPGPDHWEYDYTPEGLKFVRNLLLTHNSFLQQKRPRRIIVSREKAMSRRLVQAERTNRILCAQGFEKVLLEDYPVREQAAFFNRADCIVMPTGGNLANLVFCRPGTIVVELFGKNYAPNFTHALMGEIGLRYYGLVAEKVSRPHSEARLAGEDIDLDPDRLADIVRLALSKFQASEPDP